eukprot:g10506.t1
MPRMLDTESDTDHEAGVDRIVQDSVSLASTQVGDDYDEFRRPKYILSPVTTVVHAVLEDVDGLAPDLVSLATTQVGNIDDYDEFRRPRDPVSPASTVVYVVPDPLPCIRCGLRLEYLLYHELAHENYGERPWLSRFLYQQDKGKKKRCDVATPAETPADSEMSEDSDASELLREVVEICSEEDT